MAARFIDRVGKGIRGAPRDALVADIAPASIRGAAFGLRQSLDTIGAFLGPAVAVAAMWFSANSIPFVFWIATIPAALAVVVLALGVREPEASGRRGRRVFRCISRKSAGSAAPSGSLWRSASSSVLRALSEAFLILKARDVGLPVALAPLVLVAMNVVYAGASYPVGAFSDRGDRKTPLMAGLVALIAADAVLAVADHMPLVWLGVALWGLHMGLTQGLLATLIADVAPAALRGSAFGVFNLASGVALLAASAGAGALWDAFGSASAFWGARFWRRWRSSDSRPAAVGSASPTGRFEPAR